MLWKKINRFWKAGLAEKNRILLIFCNGKIKKRLSIVMVIVLLMINGCSNAAIQEKNGGLNTVSDIVSDTAEIDNEADTEEDSSNIGKSGIIVEDIAAVYQDIYDEAVESNTVSSLEVIRSIVNRLGESGYSAVDSENQIDMVSPEQIKQFCRQVEAQEEAEAALVVVVSAVSYIKYEFTTKNGNVEVQRSYCLCKEGCWETLNSKNYQAYTWVYSGEGYLFFEEYHMPGFDGPSGHTAVRVEPLDEMCRELNRKYLRMIGYDMNNLFTTDWNEEDFQGLNFYDLYNVLHQMKNGQYTPVIYLEEGVTYEIPQLEFESVFQTFFKIDSKALRQYTIYHEDTKTYQYRERGMYDFMPTPNTPYPEVISFEENQDGTLKLTVNAVWPEENLGKAFSHEVIIRPLEDGGFQYVSNHVIPSKDNMEAAWYAERLSDDKWQEYYGGL